MSLTATPNPGILEVGLAATSDPRVLDVGLAIRSCHKNVIIK